MVSEITTDYTGRYLDILILQGFDPYSGESRVEMSLGTGKVCAGLQKVAQEFLVLFLTEKGSNPWDVERGTDFITKLQKGLITDENMLQAMFKLGVSDIFDYLENKIDEDTPDDEILADATLKEWDLRPGSITMKVKLTTLSGDSAVYIIPGSF